ncbi:MAG TPA: UbiA family prenyltransferase [Chitinophagales bacterium]|nr:UbiA family prenyltransferase [Chitinophagales bacterium]
MASFINIRNRLWDNAQYKFSIIFCSLYVVLFSVHSFSSKILLYIVVSIILSVGIAGIGYAFNDYHDYHDDIKNNKQNLFLKFSGVQGILLVFFFFILSVFPWFILPFDRFSLLLILTEFLLFIVYALPPFRLKERGLAGVLTDALYAQVIPCFLATYTYSKIEEGVSFENTLIWNYIIWLIIVGSRNIINHQIEDFDNDINTKTITFVTNYGKENSKRQVLRLLIPLELLLFFPMIYFLPNTHHVVVIFFILYILSYLVMQKIKNKKTIFKDADDIYIFLNQKILNEFYEIHLPLLLLCYFSIIKPFFIWILILNLFIFLPIYLEYIKGFIKKYII